MRDRVSTLKVRGQLGDLLNRVELRHDEFIIERKGRPMAALIPVAKLEAMEAAARASLRTSWERLEAMAASDPLGDAAAMELAKKEVRAVRSAGKMRGGK